MQPAYAVTCNSNFPSPYSLPISMQGMEEEVSLASDLSASQRSFPSLKGSDNVHLMPDPVLGDDTDGSFHSCFQSNDFTAQRNHRRQLPMPAKNYNSRSQLVNAAIGSLDTPWYYKKHEFGLAHALHPFKGNDVLLNVDKDIVHSWIQPKQPRVETGVDMDESVQFHFVDMADPSTKPSSLVEISNATSKTLMLDDDDDQDLEQSFKSVNQSDCLDESDQPGDFVDEIEDDPADRGIHRSIVSYMGLITPGLRKGTSVQERENDCSSEPCFLNEGVHDR
jgi:hypothetical protein